MSYSHRKDRRDLVAEMRLGATPAPYHVRVYLWGTSEGYEGACDSESRACFRTVPYVYNRKTDARLLTSACIGELHFRAGAWDEEVVAHECMHAIIHRMIVLGPPWRLVEDMGDEDPQPGDVFGRRALCSQSQEEVCQQMGQWVAQVSRFLWKHDPNERWTRSAVTA